MKSSRLILIVFLLYVVTGFAAYFSTLERNSYTILAQGLPQGCHTGDNQILQCDCGGFKSTANVTGNGGNQGLVWQDFVCEDVPDPPGSCTAQNNPRLVYNGYCPTPTPTPECDPSGSEGCEFVMHSFCECKAGGGTWNPSNCLCQGSSPIVIDVAGNGFSMTDAANGVDFDINGDGRTERLGWTSAGSDEVWLVMDRNGNNSIDDGSELFGNFTSQPEPPTGEERNGFLALAVFDKPKNGGNSDGQIDRRDMVFNQLRLWRDTNHNGVSDPGEARRLSDSPIRILELQYYESRRVDEYGNEFRYRAIVRDQRGAQVGRWAWDVFLTTQ